MAIRSSETGLDELFIRDAEGAGWVTEYIFGLPTP